MNNIPAYKAEQVDAGAKKVRYLFESVGKKPIIKAIDYTFVRKLSGRKVFNLGFGDYDLTERKLLDDVNSNNGDMRKVFSTVLDTIPKFFKENGEAALWVEGSDSSAKFEINCRKKCTKKCGTVCKNLNRRIKTYRYFIDRNFVELSKEYIFFGLLEGESGDLVQYIPGNSYNGILVYCRN